MPALAKNNDLGANVLEIGPGPGLTTDWLRERVSTMTAIEIDHKLAESLKSRLADTNVTVIEGDATKMPFPDSTFTGAVSMTMLHHVPTPALQDKLFAEACRVLQPGGVFAGSDSRPSFRWRLFHVFDTCVAVDPATLAERLKAAGFTDVLVDGNEYSVWFSAKKPQTEA